MRSDRNNQILCNWKEILKSSLQSPFLSCCQKSAAVSCLHFCKYKTMSLSSEKCPWCSRLTEDVVRADSVTGLVNSVMRLCSTEAFQLYFPIFFFLALYLNFSWINFWFFWYWVFQLLLFLHEAGKLYVHKCPDRIYWSYLHVQSSGCSGALQAVKELS